MNAPEYIDKTIFKNPVSAPWDDANPYDGVLDVDQYFENVLEKLSDYSKLVFSIGCAELVVAGQSMKNHMDDDAWEYVEACWSYEMSAGYEVPEELEGEYWTGPIKGPIVLSLLTIINTVYGFDEGNSEVDSSFADAIVRTYCGESTSYLKWREELVRRLSIFTERTSGQERLPREVVDFRINILDVVSNRKHYIGNFLSGLDVEGNKYLVPMDRW